MYKSNHNCLVPIRVTEQLSSLKCKKWQDPLEELGHHNYSPLEKHLRAGTQCKKKSESKESS